MLITNIKNRKNVDFLNIPTYSRINVKNYTSKRHKTFPHNNRQQTMQLKMKYLFKEWRALLSHAQPSNNKDFFNRGNKFSSVK